LAVPRSIAMSEDSIPSRLENIDVSNFFLCGGGLSGPSAGC
jgi:hypothetical protein